MSDSHGTFATVLGCMDGRCQEISIAYAKQLFGADYVDDITEPGIDGLLAGGQHAAASEEALPLLREWVKKKASISANGHGSKHLLIVAHCDCAGNPGPYGKHLEQLAAARDLVKAWGLFDDVRIAAFDDAWKLQEVG